MMFGLLRAQCRGGSLQAKKLFTEAAGAVFAPDDRPLVDMVAVKL
jgi:hypothetical protein